MKTQNNARRQPTFLLLIMTLGLSACIPLTPSLPTPIPVTPETNSIPSWLEIYFTNPAAPQSANFEGGPDENLAAAIDKARLSVDVAANSLNLASIRDAIIRAYHRGVVVHMVMESDNMGGQDVQTIQEVGIPIKGEPTEGLMLNNFVVIDGNEVWTGSMNFTTESAYADNNNLLHIHSKVIADEFMVEFKKLFEGDLAETEAGMATPNPSLNIEGTDLEVYFLPEEASAARITELILGATKSISFLSPEFFGAVIDGAIGGVGPQVTVEGVVDASMADYGVPAPGTRLDMRADGNISGSMHESVIIIDQRIVIIGSYNFSNEVNEAVHGVNSSPIHSNVIMLFNTGIAAVFNNEFRGIYNHALTKWPPPNLPTSSLSGETTPPPAP
ncbi:MAG: phospholipase D-like domain-containing protein [Anaerolineales bacterium]|jgi:phosphatidylserine/phosphatidylglycerophosphate/cardiolipin synthase-like enzyme